MAPKRLVLRKAISTGEICSRGGTGWSDRIYSLDGGLYLMAMYIGVVVRKGETSSFELFFTS